MRSQVRVCAWSAGAEESRGRRVSGTRPAFLLECKMELGKLFLNNVLLPVVSCARLPPMSRLTGYLVAIQTSEVSFYVFQHRCLHIVYGRC